MMTLVQIRKMLVAHGLWKIRLQKAIQEGSSPFTAAEVSVDNQCEFGRWLYHLPREDKDNPVWKEVQTVHADFHQMASQILKLALAGDHRKALAAFEKTNRLTGKLVGLLTQWAVESHPSPVRKRKKAKNPT